MKLVDLFPQAAPQLKEFDVLQLTFDSRQVSQGSLFFALDGINYDGHDFVEQLLEKHKPTGQTPAFIVFVENKSPKTKSFLNHPAVVAVDDTFRALGEIASRFYGNPSKHLLICGVTGTNGKTTSTYLLESLLESWSMRPAVIGTVENRFGKLKVPALYTTPDAISLQALFHSFLKKGATAVVMEVSSHGLVQQRIAGTRFEAALFTNLTQDHLDFHGTMENYFAAKTKLFLDYPLKVRAIHQDDPYGQRLVSMCLQRGFEVVTFGRSGCNVNYQNLKMSSSGIEGDLRIHWKGQNHALRIRSPLLGSFNAQNIAGAAAVAIGLNMPLPKISEGLSKSRQVPGRLESVPNNRGVTVVVDYAHTPDALENALKTLRRIAQKRLVCVFGCGGDRDATKRPLMGAIAEANADEIYITSDNPRTENAAKIIDAIVQGLKRPEKAHRVEDRKSAIAQAIQSLAQGDLLLIAGKGHEDYQIIGTMKLPFDDRVVALEHLQDGN
ncbi:MAG: UDP-N-acetylmuramoyl-L-alanyl-D-glutamate--2,6-diaminopimelate ligase [Bdellovibrionota bacterium]